LARASAPAIIDKLLIGLNYGVSEKAFVLAGRFWYKENFLIMILRHADIERKKGRLGPLPNGHLAVIRRLINVSISVGVQSS
jgi:hypothetical protein